MTSDQDKGFEVVDKRKRRKEKPAEEPPVEQKEPEPTPPAEPEEQAAEQPVEHDQPGEEAITPDVYSLIQWFVMMLAESAWMWMGLHMNPATKKVEKDLLQAKVAIDSIVFLTDQAAPHVSEEQRHAYRALVNDLRVNFVQQSQTSST